METLQNIFLAEIVQKLGWTLVHFVWQAAAIGLILAIILKALHKSSANLRYIIACMALASVVLMPVVTFRMVNVSVAAPASAMSALAELPIADTGARAVVEIEPLPVQTAVTLNIPLKDRLIETVEPALPYLVFGWLIGVFGLSLWHLGGWTQLQRLRRQMVKQVTPALKAKLQQLSNALGIRKAVGLVESALVQVPTVIGHIKPVILLPASALTGLSHEQIEAILAHELAHIKRCDYLVNMLQTVVEILGFYHPAVWWVSHKIRVERENCCDDIAVSLCSNRVCYAKALTTMEEIRAGRPSLAVAASGGSLFARIRRLLGKDSVNEGKLSWLPSVIAMLLIAALLIPTALALSSEKNKQINVKSDRVRVYQVNRNVSDFPFERDLATPEKTGQVQSNLEILNVELEPVAQGKNILYATIKNTTNTEQLFAIHIYTRSVDYGPQGVGWGTRFFEKIMPNETKRARFVYKIQGPVTENTYIRVKFYNPPTEEQYDYKTPFAEKTYTMNDLRVYKADEVQTQTASQEQFDTVSKVFAEIQRYIRNGKYEKAWQLFTEDYKKSEYQSRGFERFVKQMEPVHPLDSAFLWEKDDFLKLNPLRAFQQDDKIILQAGAGRLMWRIYFTRDGDIWEIDDIVGYGPKILDM